ncbi:MAG TPA: class I SAM-dependent methyltransferase [Rhodanobacteraceae bacterium]|nr:class I SAM-dependent methyltransferase [Rhodanobacteraceae bacterium]
MTAIRLQCPRCGCAIEALRCRACRFPLRIDHGITRALAPESVRRLARFMGDYERIREAECRGSQDAGFYLGLPYADVTGRHRGQWRMRARSYDYLVRRLLPGADAGGRILDLGAGNGWLSFRLALAGYRPYAVDLLTNERDGLAAARHFRSRLPRLFPRFQADLGHLPFADRQFDAAVFNASFHYAEDGQACLREALRCLRPGGTVVISDTPWYPRAEDGERMLAERRASFLREHGTAADSLASLHYLTDARLQAMAQALSLRWEVHRPWYGLAWAARPVLARLRRAREPSRFRLYVARKPG